MLELSYMGPKPIINQHGVFFKNQKWINISISLMLLVS